MIGIGDGGQCAVAIAYIHCIRSCSGNDGSVVGDGHGLRRLGAQHHRRVAIENPGLIGAYCLSSGSAVMVEDAHDAIDRDATPSMLDIAVVAPHKNVNTFILAPHRRLPRLTDVGHQGTNGAGRLGSGIIGGMHPCLSKAVVALAHCGTTTVGSLSVIIFSHIAGG